MHSLSFLVFFAASSLATKLLLPLYQYPDAGTWDPVYTAIENNPNSNFQVIMNVDSGPGGDAEPDSNFVTGASRLNSYPNVETLGYVHCQYGAADQSDIIQNVTKWAAWSAYAGGNTSVGGIFFDEIPNSEGASSDVTYMQAVMGAATSAFGSGPFTSMLNPGASVEHPELWDLATFIVIFEAAASEYSASVLSSNIPAGKAAQSAILIYDFASFGTESTAAEWLQAMSAAGVASAHILDHDYIQATTASSPASIGSVALELAVLPNSGSSSVDTTSASSATTASVAETQSKTTAAATYLTVTYSAAPTSLSVASSETTTLYIPDPLETTAASKPGKTSSSCRHAHTASARHEHHPHGMAHAKRRSCS